MKRHDFTDCGFSPEMIDVFESMQDTIQELEKKLSFVMGQNARIKKPELSSWLELYQDNCNK